MKNKAQLIQTIIAAVIAVVLIILIVKPSGGASFNTDASTYFDLTHDEVQELIDDAGLEHDDLISGDYDGYYFDAYTDEYITISVHSGSIDTVILSADGKYSFGDLNIGDFFEGNGSSEELINDGWTHDYGLEGRDLWEKDDKYLDIHYEDNVITLINCSFMSEELENYWNESEYEESLIDETVEESDISQTEMSSSIPQIQISDIFVPMDSATSWSLSNDTGTYYMIPVISDGTNTIYFNSSNELVGYAEVYYMDVESIGQTENGGLTATGTMYSNTNSPVYNGVFTVTWDSYESMDWATVEVLTGTEMTDISMVGEYGYSGMVGEDDSSTAGNAGYTTMYVVNCNESITLRTSPSTDAAEIRQIPLGEPVSFIETAANGFYMISYMGDTGYALASYLSTGTESSIDNGYPTLRVVNCNESITLRTSPSTDAAEIRQIPLGATVSYIETSENGFYKVIYLGDTGYALASYLQFI